LRDCKVGVAINTLGNTKNESQFQVGKLLSGNVVVLDYPLFTNKRSEFTYLAIKRDIHAFGISKTFLIHNLL